MCVCKEFIQSVKQTQHFNFIKISRILSCIKLKFILRYKEDTRKKNATFFVVSATFKL